MALERVQKRRHIGEVILIWPDTLVPAHVRGLLDKIKAVYGARISLVKVRPDAVARLLSYVDVPEEAPEMHRSFVNLLNRFGVRELPALIVDGQLVATGELAVLGELDKLLR